jgi:AraC family transcriptional regulator
VDKQLDVDKMLESGHKLMIPGDIERSQRRGGQKMRTGDRHIESAIEFSRGRVEICAYDWRREWNGICRARPDMYIFELNLCRVGKVPLPSPSDSHPVPGSFQAGDVAFIPPHSAVQRNLAPGRRRALLCMFDRGWLDDLLPRVIPESGSKLGTTTGLGRIEWLLRNIHQEMRQNEDFGSAIVVESFANALAVELARRLALRMTTDGSGKGGLAPWRMRLVHERITSNIAAPGLEELAELCGMTVRHLCRAFKAETGKTPGQYIDAAMARHARTLLSQTNLSLSEIAHRLGFATSTSFSNAFQRATGLKPRQIERPARLVSTG